MKLIFLKVFFVISIQSNGIFGSEPPYFTNQPLPMETVVDVNAPPNTTVFTLQAKAPDPDSDIHYVLVKDKNNRFEVDERSGLYECILILSVLT